MAESLLNIKITTTGGLLEVDGKGVKLNKNIEKKLSDKGILKKDLLTIGRLVRDQISSNIARGLRFDTKRPVEKLSGYTIKKKGFSKPLWETGRMVRSVIFESVNDGVVVRMSNAQYAKRRNKDGKPVKSKKPPPTISQVAEWNNNGTKGTPTHPPIPARPFFGINKTDMKKFSQIVFKDRLFK
jgi:phage gpG-like protein